MCLPVASVNIIPKIIAFAGQSSLRLIAQGGNRLEIEALISRNLERSKIGLPYEVVLYLMNRDIYLEETLHVLRQRAISTGDSGS
jgi:hypothetical protein